MPRLRREETAQRWASRLAQFENSNLSVAQFCQSIDCSVGSFYLWKRKLAKTTPAPSAFLRGHTLIPAPTDTRGDPQCELDVFGRKCVADGA